MAEEGGEVILDTLYAKQISLLCSFVFLTGICNGTLTNPSHKSQLSRAINYPTNAPTLYWNYVLGYEIRHTDHFCCHDIEPPTIPPTLYWNYVLGYK